MPTLTMSEMTNSAGTLVRTRLNQSICGDEDVAEDQQRQYVHQYGPVIRFTSMKRLVLVLRRTRP